MDEGLTFRSQASTFLKPLPYCQGTSYVRGRLSLRTKAVLWKLRKYLGLPVTSRDSSCLRSRTAWGYLVPSLPSFSIGTSLSEGNTPCFPALDKDYVQTASSSLPRHQTLGLKHPNPPGILEVQQAGGRRQRTSMRCYHLVPISLLTCCVVTTCLASVSQMSEKEDTNVPPWPNK